MKKSVVAVIAGIAFVSLTACSSFEGQVGKKTDSFEDEHGRKCTAVKWGDSASIDCDYPPSEYVK